MRLGGSLARRRGRKAGGSKKPTEERTPREGRSIGRRQWLAAAGLALVGWGGGYIVATQLVFPAPPPPGDLFEVPDVRGLGLASARERLAGVGLELGPIDSLLHPTISAELIVGQSPIPGQLARPQAPVSVTLSLGPQMRSIPDVVRLDEDGARIVLESSGFVVRIDTAQSEIPRGYVVETFPPADTVLALPAEVQMIVSTGPPLVLMPFVLGMEEEEVVQMLDSLGLVVVEVTEVFRFGRERGIVVEQEPAADTEMERGDEVRLSVGRRGRGEEH